MRTTPNLFSRLKQVIISYNSSFNCVPCQTCFMVCQLLLKCSHFPYRRLLTLLNIKEMPAYKIHFSPSRSYHTLKVRNKFRNSGTIT